jgi:hypothetical protein
MARGKVFLGGEIYQNIKYLEKNYNICGGHLRCIKSLPRNWEGYYAYS